MIAGSSRLSHNASENAEKVLFLHDVRLADQSLTDPLRRAILRVVTRMWISSITLRNRSDKKGDQEKGHPASLPQSLSSESFPLLQKLRGPYHPISSCLSRCTDRPQGQALQGRFGLLSQPTFRRSLGQAFQHLPGFQSANLL